MWFSGHAGGANPPLARASLTLNDYFLQGDWGPPSTPPPHPTNTYLLLPPPPRPRETANRQTVHRPRSTRAGEYLVTRLLGGRPSPSATDPVGRSLGRSIRSTHETAPVLVHASQDLEFVVPAPESSHVKICPAVAILEPGTGLRIEVSFSPPPLSGLGPGTIGASRDAAQEPGPDSSGTEHAQLPAPGVAEGSPPSCRHESVRGIGPSQAGRRSDGEVPMHMGVLEDACAEGRDAGPTDEGFQASGTAERPRGMGARECGRAEEGENRADQPWSRHGRWRVPCFLRPRRGEGAGGRGEEGGELPPIALEVRRGARGSLLPRHPPRLRSLATVAS